MEISEETLKLLMSDAPSYLAMNVLARHLEAGTNLVKTADGERYSTSSLACEMGVTKQSASTRIRRLIEAGIVAKVKCSDGVYLAMNPRYCAGGEEVLYEVALAFGII